MISLSRRNPRRDQTEGPIFAAFRALGWTVLPLSVKDGPDAIIGKHRINLLIECKTGKTKLQANQQAWADAWHGAQPVVVRSVDDVIRLDRTLHGLTETGDRA